MKLLERIGIVFGVTWLGAILLAYLDVPELLTTSPIDFILTSFGLAFWLGIFPVLAVLAFRLKPGGGLKQGLVTAGVLLFIMISGQIGK